MRLARGSGRSATAATNDSERISVTGADAGGRPNLFVLVVFSLLGLAVVAPFVGRGWLLLLDWVQGPHPGAPRGFWGLDGEISAGVPFAGVVYLLDRLIGAAAVSWMLVAVTFPVGAVGMARLVGGTRTARIGAGLVYVLSPVVYERLWAGQVAFLIAYALLPWATAALVRADTHRWPRSLGAALWIAVVMAFSTHFVFILALLGIGVMLRRPTRRRWVWATSVALAVLACSAYLLAGSSQSTSSIAVSEADVVSFRTRGDPILGLHLNVLAQYGFWRAEPKLPKDDVPGWPIVLTGMLVVVGAGILSASRSPDRKRLLVPLLFAAAAGYFLALGDQGVAAPLYRLLFDHVPGFAIMREPQKFVVLLPLAYAVFFGIGAERLIATLRSSGGRRAFTAVALAIPVAYDPSLFFGLAGRLRASQYPASYRRADQLIGQGPGKILALPWHQYLAFSFTDKRIISNPAAAVFQRDVIAGDNVELPGLRSGSRLDRSRYLEFVLSEGNAIRHFGAAMAPLGVQYVTVFKTVDWGSYSWLDQQTDLHLVYDDPALKIYVNKAADPSDLGTRRRWEVADWGELLHLGERENVSRDLVIASRLEPGPLRAPVSTAAATLSTAPSGVVSRRSPVEYRAIPAEPLLLPEPFDPTWRSPRGGAREDARGVAAFGQAVDRAYFDRWRALRTAYVVSAGAVLGLACILMREEWKLRRTAAIQTKQPQSA
ncbi:MAG: hypothetical protein QOF60_1793 [Actinomycetota bacterium]|jgi:hypothetical protein|nr:hypothetical protein [Actinomycetota bacterium]